LRSTVTGHPEGQCWIGELRQQSEQATMAASSTLSRRSHAAVIVNPASIVSGSTSTSSPSLPARTRYMEPFRRLLDVRQ
jgi:hypothetical protein